MLYIYSEYSGVQLVIMKKLAVTNFREALLFSTVHKKQTDVAKFHLEKDNAKITIIQTNKLLIHIDGQPNPLLCTLQYYINCKTAAACCTT